MFFVYTLSWTRMAELLEGHFNLIVSIQIGVFRIVLILFSKNHKQLATQFC